jgi:hypothetical protein
MMQDICKIFPGSSDRGQCRVEVSPKKLCHAKVRDFSAELCIKLYICRLNVTMYDAALNILHEDKLGPLQYQVRFGKEGPSLVN